MKLTVLFLFITMSVQAQQKGDNTIIIGHHEPIQSVMLDLKRLLAESDYSIKTYDTEINLIETEFKQVNYMQTRLVILVNDSTVTIKGFANNPAYDSKNEFKNEYRPTKLSIMAQGFDEMNQVADVLYKKYLISREFVAR